MQFMAGGTNTTSRQQLRLWLITVHSTHTHTHSARLQSVVQLEFNLLRRSCCARFAELLPLSRSRSLACLSLSLCITANIFCWYTYIAIVRVCVRPCADSHDSYNRYSHAHTHPIQTHTHTNIQSSNDKLFS